ncbi:MAG: hypothetical protein QM784_32590 [Polyangiaceae bacterium]
MWLFWGFTVDDALITARMAHHLRAGVGYRFNPEGPLVDAVTPLGFAHVLAPFAKLGPWNAWQAARWLGALSWGAAATWLGWDLRNRRACMTPFLLLCGLSPVGAWATSGMETGLVIALVTYSTTRHGAGLLAAGIAAALRPELLPYALVLAAGRSNSLRTGWRTVGMTLAPAAAVAITRLHYFGSAYPLAAVAKPAVLGFGLLYVSQTVLLGGPFHLWLGPGWNRLEREERVLALAIVAHLASVLLVGGDWMVLLRLSAPVFPGALRIAALLLSSRSVWSALPGWVLAVVATAFLSIKTGWPGRHIVEQRTKLVEDMTQRLAFARVVGGLDVGFLGVAHRHTIVDFAGVTSPSFAHLAGGHTSKRIEPAHLRTRNVDHLVLLLDDNAPLLPQWNESRFAREVESRVANIAVELQCVPEATVPLAWTAQRYLVVRCPTAAADATR